MDFQGATFSGDSISANTWTDWKLVMLEVPVISPPEVQSSLLQVPGRDGLLRLTEALDGTVHYYSRTWTATFYVDDYKNFDDRCSEVMDFLHGKYLKVVSDADPDYYYAGEFTVDSIDYANGTLTIVGTVDPYKMETTSSLDDWLWDPFDFENGVVREYKDLSVDGTLELTIIGSRKPVRPEFIVASTDGSGMTLIYNGVSYALPEGRSMVPAINVGEGEYLLTFIGSGSVSVDYRGGRL